MTPTASKFSPETIAIAEIASVIILQPVNLVAKMTYNAACRHAYNLLVAARNYQDERADLIAAGKVSE